MELYVIKQNGLHNCYIRGCKIAVIKKMYQIKICTDICGAIFAWMIR